MACGAALWDLAEMSLIHCNGKLPQMTGVGGGGGDIRDPIVDMTPSVGSPYMVAIVFLMNRTLGEKNYDIWSSPPTEST